MTAVESVRPVPVDQIEEWTDQADVLVLERTGGRGGAAAMTGVCVGGYASGALLGDGSFFGRRAGQFAAKG